LLARLHANLRENFDQASNKIDNVKAEMQEGIPPDAAVTTTTASVEGD